jgi:hypothetical protein
MLHKDPFIINAETFALIQTLQTIPELNEFQLVGGTALALQLGHRNSIDIDLFSQNEFDTQEIIGILSLKNLVEIVFQKEKNTLLANINGIKTDFIRHPYPLLKPPIVEEGIRFLSKEDISGMKIHAIVNSGKRLKDFVDMYFLLEHFTMNQMIGFYRHKYTHMSPMVPLKALTYFDDIDPQMDPPKMKKPLPMEKIKKRLLESVLKMNKKF